MAPTSFGLAPSTSLSVKFPVVWTVSEGMPDSALCVERKM